jgi:anthranilate phosphoribosyltransferase
MNNDELLKINPLLSKVVEGTNLKSDEAAELFETIFLHDHDGYHLSILFSALHAKGETSDELLGYINTYKKLAEQINISAPTDKIIDVSGTGGGSFKTINVSTAVAFVLASIGYTVPKASFYGITSPTGSADIFANFGIDIMKLNKEKIENALNKVGICPYYVPFFSPKLKNRGEIFKRVYKDHQIKVKSIAHIATNAFSPFQIKHRIYGCYSEKYLHSLAELFMNLDYKHSMVVYSEIGMPELSNVGTSIIVEQKVGAIQRRIIKPEDMGVAAVEPKDIACSTREQNIQDFINILKGKERGPKFDLVAINVGAALYVLNSVTSLNEGTQKAQEILLSGNAYAKLDQLRSYFELEL